MASQSGLPPRRMSNDSVRRSRSLPKTTFDLLIDMGFNKQLSAKVIAAVGDKDIHIAVDWLMSHLEDPNLKDSTPREYVVYLCPTGTFLRSLQEFWVKSESICGWNGVHAYFPHITLSPFFTVPDDKITQLIDLFTSLQAHLQHSPGNVHLEQYSVSNFIGLFVSEDHHAYFNGVMAEFSKKLKELSIQLETRKKQLHLTLAYHFRPDQYETLNGLSKDLNDGQDMKWDIRLYSRDHRYAQSHVYNVQRSFTASSNDELDLFEGDYMVVEEGRKEGEFGDGWLYGSSWLTGCSGVFPALFCKRTAEMWTWTLHKSITLDTDQPDCPPPYNDIDIASLYSQVKRRRSAPSLPPRTVRGPRKVIVMRHGERVDFVMGKEWMHQCFNKSGSYNRTDINLPSQLPWRRQYGEYFGDSPLTEIGLFQAQKTGEAMLGAGVSVTHVYSSPAFRCIQTAAQVIRALGADITINIEPALFEWLQWYQIGLPTWLTAEELLAYGYPVNRAYEPALNHEKLSKCFSETIAQYYQRNSEFTRGAIDRHTQSGETILIVGHAATVDVCMRQCRGLQPRTTNKFHEFLSKVPYCCLAMYVENVATKQWAIEESPVLPFTHSSNKGMFWKAAMNL